MAHWSSNAGKVYLPPSAPVARVLRTDEYVTGTDVYFHASSDRLLIVGHPYYDVESDGNVQVPKVSANQYRVFRCKLPDPNKFALIEKNLYNSDRERLVWRLIGLEVGRGGPLGVGSTGHPLWNKVGNTENPSYYLGPQQQDERQNMSIDPKQTQMLIAGCAPAIGEYWDLAKPCKTLPEGACPPIQLVNTVIQDGDMGDIGFGAANFPKLQQDRSAVPLDLVDSIALWPDFFEMTKDTYGDSVFFFGKREQLYARHLFTHAGTIGEPIPDVEGVYTRKVDDTRDNENRKNLGSYLYFTTPSGSLNSSDSQIFNRPYWIRRAQGTNNGICWGNDLFITVFDNTRNVNFNLSVKSDKEPLAANPVATGYKYKATDFKQYIRHVEEFEIEMVFQLCKITLDADILAHLQVMNPRILEEWQLAFIPPAPSDIGDAYRYIKSLATMCPPTDTPAEVTDPYKDYTFWDVDLTERFSSDLSQFALGRKFLFQTGLINGKRPRLTQSISSAAKSNKRKRTK
ncbi:L1 [human papillomavirus 131]|uniref:Major capsid protein L1 n=1 Tax=human papillomavirus 131 TaxID=909330 RepID=E7BQ92_9PAPI|nr:L1 [human papillomavirus 131]ADQ85959.1 L1 [human papillomavirus 131]